MRDNKNDLYKKRAKSLRNIGVKVPGVDLRTGAYKWSAATKAQITKEYNRLRHVAENPELYERRTVAEKNARKLRKHYHTKGRRVYVRKTTKDSEVHVKNAIVEIRDHGVITRTVARGAAVFEALDNLDPDKLYTVKIGKNDFSRTFRDGRDFKKYLKFGFLPKDPDTTFDDLLPELQIVEYERA